MPTKRDLLAHFTSDELKDIVAHFGLEADARSPAAMLEAVASSKKAKLAPILGDYLGERLKELCEALGLDSSGTKQTMVERLTGKSAPATEQQAESSATSSPEQAKQTEPATPRSQRGPLTLPQLATEKLFAGSGEMRARCRAHNWEATALGAVEGWPPALRMLAPLVLAAGVPSALLWGPAQTVLYNDAYISLLGAQHPVLLGRPHFDVVPESRATFGPLFARVQSGETVSLADVPTTFRRDAVDGPLTRSLYTFSFAPVREVDDPAGPVVGIYGVVLETTAEVTRRATDARQAYLLALSDALRPLADPMEIQGEAARLIGERLGVDRVLYADTEGDTIVVHRDWVRGIASMAGRYPASVWGEYVAVYLRGEPYVVHDVACDPKVDDTALASYRSVDIAAFIGMGLVKQGAHVASFGVHSRTPRAWTTEDIELVRETAERTWDAVRRARAEAALRESEAKYRTIFDSIDEGFGTHEVLYDDAGRPVDIRYLETNSAFERHTGVSDCVGRRAREISPNLEDAWIETFARVARTGLPLRFEQENADVGRWYNVYLSRVGGDGSPVVAAVFTDITERKRAEAALATAASRDAFLVRLADALRPLADAFAVQEVAARMLGEHLGANLVHYGEVTDETVRIHQGYGNGMSAMVGSFRLASDGWGAAILENYRAGHTSVCRDVNQDPTITAAEAAQLSNAGLVAYVGVPLIKRGTWVAVLAVHFMTPRDWQADDLAIIKEVAERTWAAVERARAEQALREGEERLRLFGEASSDVIWIRDAETRRMEYVSPAFEAIYGVQRDEVLGHEPEHVWADLIVPENREGALAALERVRAGKRITFEFRIRRPDGQLRWLRDTDFPVQNENGLVQRIGWGCEGCGSVSGCLAATWRSRAPPGSAPRCSSACPNQRRSCPRTAPPR